MSFEFKPTHELIQIAASGGGFRLDAGLRPTHELIQIASAAKNSGAHITFSGLELRPTHELIQISAAGKGVIILEG
jgi:hypothetical protein